MHPSALRCPRIMVQSFLWRVCSMSECVYLCVYLCMCEWVCQSTSETLWLGGIANLHLPMVTDWAPLWKHHPPLSSLSEAPPADSHLQGTAARTQYVRRSRGIWEPNAPPICPLSLNPPSPLFQALSASHYILYTLHTTVSSRKKQQRLDESEGKLVEVSAKVVMLCFLNLREGNWDGKWEINAFTFPHQTLCGWPNRITFSYSY